MCSLYFLKGILPFGDVTVFWNYAPDNALTVFHRFSTHLHNGTFSLLNPSGAYGMTMWEAFPFYLSSPFIIFAALIPYKAAWQALSICNILRIGLAGPAMCLLLTRHGDKLHSIPAPKTTSGSKSLKELDIRVDPLLPAIFSTAYALSSCFLSRLTDYRFLDFAYLLPLLYIGYERLVKNGKHGFYYLICVIMLLFNASLTFPILLLLLIHLITTDRRDYVSHPILRYTGTSILALISSAITVYPTLHSLIIYGKSGKKWPDFAILRDWLTLFSSFLPGSDSTYRYMNLHGSNMYFGLLLLFMALLSFARRDITTRERIGRLIYTVILILSVNTTAVDHIFSLGTFEQDALCITDFIVVFFGVLTAFENLYRLRDIHWGAFVPIILLPALLALAAGMYADHPVATADLFPVLILLVLYPTLYILLRKKSIKEDSFMLIAMVLLILELFFNTEHQIYNISKEGSVISDQLSYLSENDSDYYDPFTVNGLVLGEDISFDTKILPESYILPCTYAPPLRQSSDFETANAIYTSLGGDGYMFDITDIPVKAIPDTVLVSQRSLPENILTYDSTDLNQEDFNVLLSFTPEESAPLYFSTDKISYLGDTKSGSPIEINLNLPALKTYFNFMQVKTAYFNQTGYDKLKEQLKKSSPTIAHSLFSLSLSTENEDDRTLILPIGEKCNIKIFTDKNIVLRADAPAGKTGIRLTPGTHNVRISCSLSALLIPLLVSLVGIFLFFVICRKHSLKKPLRKTAEISNSFCIWTCRHYVAVFSFLLPLSVMICSCILSSFAPFGGNAYFKGDGSAITLSSQYLLRDLMQAGNPDYIPFTGNGMNAYYMNPAPFTNLWLKLFPSGSLVVPTTIVSILFVSLCGFTMYLYLTKRLSGHRFSSKDYRILAITTAYAISAYNVNFRQFLNWPLMVAALPLLLLAMDHLILKKQCAPYIFILSCCMIMNVMSALYLCVFLLCWFFMYDFDNLKDIIKKGIRFAISSCLSAGLSFWLLAVSILSRSSLAYNESDSVLPDPTGFYQSYFSSLRQLFILSEPITVTEKDGAINLYCGIISILLLTVFCVFAKRNKRFWGRIILAAFILFSSNNDLMSYLWNGLHYQTKVPNRYSFLLIFLVLDMACDGITVLRHLNRRKILTSLLLTSVFLGIITIGSSTDMPVASCYLTFGLMIVYGFILYLYQNKNIPHRQALGIFLVFLTVIELTANSAITMHEDCSADRDYADLEADVTDYLKKNQLGDDKQVRVAYLSYASVNQHWFNDVASSNQFNSLTTLPQCSLSNSYGLYNGINTIHNSTNGTPFTNAMLNTGYMIIDPIIENPCIDTAHYRVIGSYDSKLILQNDRTLSLAFYVPESFKELTEKTNSVSLLANNFAASFDPDNRIFTDTLDISIIKDADTFYNDDVANSCYIEDLDNGSLSPYLAHLKIVPEKDGEYYFRASEFYYLGNLISGSEYDFKIPIHCEEDSVNLVRYDDDNFQAFYDKASQHTLKLSTFDNGIMEGTIDFPDDGYLILSVPYDAGWNATLDGKPAEIDYFKNGAMLISGGPGEHHLRMEYHTPKKTETILITIPFWIIFMILVILEGRRKRKSRNI